MRRVFLHGLILLTKLAVAGTVPTTITYQGSLSDKNGVPVDGERQMSFRITNSDGTQVYWSSRPMPPVPINKGLFAVQLDLNPDTVDWQNVTPFIEATIDHEVLSPREPINTGPYAKMSASVIDGAVTYAKLAPSLSAGAGFGLVPPGAILMFAKACPAGWQYFSDLDGRFPRGNSTYGVFGGTTTHSHSIAAQSVDHSHAAPIFQDGPTGPGFGSARPQDNPWGGMAVGGHVTITSYVTGQVMNNPIASKTSPNIESTKHDHGGKTGDTEVLPPYRDVVFCQKL